MYSTEDFSNEYETDEVHPDTKRSAFIGQGYKTLLRNAYIDSSENAGVPNIDGSERSNGIDHGGS